MATRVGINGFGRIGRQSLKALIERAPDVEVVAVNDLVDAEMNALLFKHDSTYGAYPGDVRAGDSSIIIDGREIKILAEKDPATLPWGDLGVDIVLESTGIFTDALKARAHIDAGAKKVIISAPATHEDITIVLGVNEDRYDPTAHHIISNASCTTNCLAPADKVVHDGYTIERGLMNTIHSYTNDQRILDVAHKDPRRARSAGQNIIPTSTGAARALALVIPDLKGKFDGFSLRVPTPTVSVVDFTAIVSRPTSVEELNAAFRTAAAGPLEGILGVSDEPLVSMDFKGDSRSSIIDADSTMVLGGTMVKVIAWYDNEWGYSCRVADLIAFVAARLPVAARPMDKLTIRDADVAGKRVFVRVDFNVPLADGKVTDDSRIRAAIPTIVALLQGGASVILASHLGRPDGKVQDGLRLRPVGERLTQLLHRNVPVTGDALGVGTEDAIKRLRPGEVLMLENLRFHAEEEKNDPAFAAALASYADIFVNDAFGTAHRAHASTVGIATLLPAYAGLLMEREIEMLSKLLEAPERPFAAILGGAKVSDKIGVIDNLLSKVDMLVLGGGMANTFLLAQGKAIGKSLAEPDRADDARRILAKAAANGVRVILPVDVIVAKEVTRGTEYKTLQAEKIPASWHIVDLGKASQDAIVEALADVRTVFWNGPLGVFEIPSFAHGTKAVARILAERADAGATVIVGGGDSVAAVTQQGLADRMTHISTGGGASLEFLEGRELPGVAVLLDRPAKPAKVGAKARA